MEANCQICEREHSVLEKHHLVPKNRKGETILVCPACGDQIHQLFSNKELVKGYNTLEKLLASKAIQKWIDWIQKKPVDFNVCMRKKKRR